jgi:hypothetical protein
MAPKIEKADVWSGEIRDEVGGLAAVLSPLVAAGADFSFLIARRKPDCPGAGSGCELFHGRSGFEKLLTILDVWYPLLEIARADPGDRWSLQAAASGERGRGRLVRATIPEELLDLRRSRQA